MKKFAKISLITVSLFSCALLMTSCTPIKAEDISSKLFPNVWALLAQLLAFIVLVIAIVFFLYKPIKKYMNKRKSMLDDEVNITLKEKEKAMENTKISEENIAKSKDKAKQIVDQATYEANKKASIIVDDANREAQKKIETADVIIEKNKNDAIKEIRNEIVNVSLSASEEILKREVDEKDNKKIIDDFVKQLDEAKGKK